MFVLCQYGGGFRNPNEPNHLDEPNLSSPAQSQKNEPAAEVPPRSRPSGKQMIGFSFPCCSATALALLVSIQVVVPVLSPNSRAAAVEPERISDSLTTEVELERIEHLVAQLGSPIFAARQAAAQELRKIGEPALDALEQAAAESEDLELRFGAAKLARAIGPRTIGELHRFEGHEDRIISVAFSSDGRRALSGGGEKPQPDGSWLPGTDFSVRLWDVPTGEELRRFHGHSHAVMSVDLSPDGRYAVSGSMDKTVRLWDVETGKEVRQFRGHTGWVWSVAFSPDGRRVLSAGSDDKTARLWDVETGAELQRLEGHTGRVLSAAFSPDGKQAITSGGDDDPSLRLWDLKTGEELRRFSGHRNWVWSVAFSPDGDRILSGSNDRTMRLWDVATGEQLRVYTHGAAVRRVAFSPDGNRALTGNHDGTLRLWDLKADTELRRFQGHRGLVEGVAYSPNNRFALSSGYDGTMRLWRLPM